MRFDGVQPAVVGQPRHRGAHRRMHAVGAVQEVAALRRAACGCPSTSQPSAEASTGSGWVPWLTCGSCCGSPSSSRLRGRRRRRRWCWPGRTGRPRRSPTGRGCRAAPGSALAKSHAVPPITQPAMVGDERRGRPPRRSPASGAGVPAWPSWRPARGSTPGVDDVAKQVLHHGVRLRDDADAPAVLVDQAGDDRGRRCASCRCRAGRAPPGTTSPGRSSAAVMSAAVSARARQRRAAAGAGARRSRMSITAVGGRSGSPARHRLRGRSRSTRAERFGLDRRARASARTAAGRKRRRPWVLARSITTSVGSRRVVALEDLDAARTPVARGRRSARRAPAARRARTCSPSRSPRAIAPRQPHPALRLACPRRGVPVGRRLRRVVGDENVGVVGPFVDGIVQPVEMRPPERLVLAPVVAARGGDHRDRRLLGCARRERRRRRSRPACVASGVVDLDCAAVADRLRAQRGDAGFEWRGPAASRAVCGWTGSRSGCSPRSP